MRIRKSGYCLFLLTCLAAAPVSAEVLCSPEGAEEHDRQKYKGQVPKDYMVYGLLDTLNYFDASADNKYLEIHFGRVKEKAESVREWYAKQGITIPEAECVLSQQAQQYIDSLLAKNETQAQNEVLAEAKAEEPKYRQWLKDRFPAKKAIATTCIPNRAATVDALKRGYGCLDGILRDANEEIIKYEEQNFQRFILTSERKEEIDAAISAFEASYNQLWIEIDDQIENWQPLGIAERCFDDICLGDPIAKHADKLQPIDRNQIQQQADIIEDVSGPQLASYLASSSTLSESEMLELSAYSALSGGLIDQRGLNLMLREETPFCNGKIYSGSIKDGDMVTYVTVGSLNNQTGKPIIGIRSLWRNLSDVPRSGPGFDQFEEAVQKRYSDDSIDRFDATSSININRNMGPFVQVKFKLSSVNYNDYVEPAKTSFCGQPKELTW